MIMMMEVIVVMVAVMVILILVGLKEMVVRANHDEDSFDNCDSNNDSYDREMGSEERNMYVMLEIMD